MAIFKTDGTLHTKIIFIHRTYDNYHDDTVHFAVNYYMNNNPNLTITGVTYSISDKDLLKAKKDNLSAIIFQC